MKRLLPIFVVGCCLALMLAGFADACPTCKDGLAAPDAQTANIARGYFYSILLMLAMPFTLAGSFGLYVWREFRRQQQDPLANLSGPAGTSGPPSHDNAGMTPGLRQSAS